MSERTKQCCIARWALEQTGEEMDEYLNRGIDPPEDLIRDYREAGQLFSETSKCEICEQYEKDSL